MKKPLLILFLLLITGFLPAQIRLDPSQVQEASVIPREMVFVHYNNSLIFTGEYIWYKLYTLDAESGNPGQVSKVAYVELVGEDGTRVFKHKLKLERGTGRGDFFIPTTIPSGNYKLLGYTNWMLNGGEENIFRGDVAILNPYRGDQSAITPENDDEVISEGISAEDELETGNISGDLTLNIDRRTYASRQKVLLKLDGDAEAAEGNYSVSVRRSETSVEPEMPGARNFRGLYKGFRLSSAEEIFLPELRGELLTGRIVPADNYAQVSVQNVRIALSIPGEDKVMKVAGTNSKGEFFFNIDGDYSGTKAILEPIGAEKERFKILLSETAAIEHVNLNFNKFYISPEMKEMILERSVHNQIENAYYSVKPDTLLISDLRRPFYEVQPIVYRLDDYTRFPTLRETFVEITGEAFVRNIGGVPTVRVRPLEKASVTDLPPLILVDGVVVQDHRVFLNIPAVEIESIGLIRNNYYLGPQLFQGVLDVTTTAGNFHERYTPPNAISLDLDRPQPSKQYFKQVYDQSTNESIPDFRYQLLWQPTIEFIGSRAQIDFYTSDVKGTFEIRIEGFTRDGKPVSLRKTFRVE